MVDCFCKSINRAATDLNDIFFSDGLCVFSLVPLINFNPVLMLLQGGSKLCALIA